MVRLVIKTGMANEYQIAKAHSGPSVTVLTGVQTISDLEKHCPSDTQAVLSFGMCGGLRPYLPVVGQTILASVLVDADNNLYYPDLDWTKRLFAATHAYTQRYFSNDQYNTSNTPAQKAEFWQKYQAWAMDDESLAVARFAQKHRISFAICRNISDAWNDNVSITANLLNSIGDVNIWNVIKAITTDPDDMIKIWRNYNLSNSELGVAAVQLGPNFCWRDK